MNFKSFFLQKNCHNNESSFNTGLLKRTDCHPFVSLELKVKAGNECVRKLITITFFQRLFNDEKCN